MFLLTHRRKDCHEEVLRYVSLHPKPEIIKKFPLSFYALYVRRALEIVDFHRKYRHTEIFCVEEKL